MRIIPKPRKEIIIAGPSPFLFAKLEKLAKPVVLQGRQRTLVSLVAEFVSTWENRAEGVKFSEMSPTSTEDTPRAILVLVLIGRGCRGCFVNFCLITDYRV